MKKWILPLLAAVFVLQGCADKERYSRKLAAYEIQTIPRREYGCIGNSDAEGAGGD